jgi:methionyl-tRNA synthetase
MPDRIYVTTSIEERHGRAVRRLWSLIDQVNREIDRVRPWELLDRGERALLQGHLDRWLAELYRIGYWLAPFLPRTHRRILEILRQDSIRPCGPLFPRIRRNDTGERNS